MVFYIQGLRGREGGWYPVFRGLRGGGILYLGSDSEGGGVFCLQGVEKEKEGWGIKIYLLKCIKKAHLPLN